MKQFLTLAIGLAALIPLPAAAEDPGPVCSGVAADWLGGTFDGSDMARAADPLRQEAATGSGQHPWLAFHIAETAQAMRIEAMTIGDGDPSITLSTPDGEVLASNDDVDGTLNSRIETTLEPGDYCVQLVPVGNPVQQATVQVSRMDQPPLLAAPVDLTINACTPDTPARDLTDGPLGAALAQGRVEETTGAEVVYLRFTLDQDASMTLRAASEELDPYLKLFDGTGALIAENDDADGLNSRLDFLTPLAAGDYCIGMAPLSAREGDITVSAEALDRNSYLRTAWRKGEMPPPADSGYPVQALDLTRDRETVLLHDGSAQWVTFEMPAPGVLIVAASGQSVGVDTKLALFGANGMLAGENDDANGTTDAQLGPVLLEAGRYRMAVMDVNRVDQQGAPIKPIGLVFDRFERVE
ncbi:MAG: DVUA0089 family protein [Paracoccus sp. (in: a-proteobacteria)]|uniref:DVUA0089 family protein n=1 Tax=Paracoccus sp. TaxID=267 RepID=UPI00391B6CDA